MAGAAYSGGRANRYGYEWRIGFGNNLITGFQNLKQKEKYREVERHIVNCAPDHFSPTKTCGPKTMYLNTIDLFPGVQPGVTLIG